MVEKKIKSLADCELKTVFQTHFLSIDEVKIVQFKDQRTFEALLKLGTFVEAGRDEKVVKKIPLIVPEVDEETLVEMPVIEERHEHILHNLKTIDEEIDPPEGVDPDIPDLPCPEEDENPKFDDEEIEIEEVPVEDVIIPGNFGSPEELMEEIPIEEQRKDLPELKPAWQDGGQDDTGGFEVEEVEEITDEE
jgi:hypothetical protein